MKALIVALALLVPASSALTSAPDLSITGYILIGHPCSKEAEVLLVVFNDGSFTYLPVADIHPTWHEPLAQIRQNLPHHQILIKGPFDACPTRS